MTRPTDVVRAGPGVRRLAAEFGVIVLGVLVALAVDAWWDTRQEQEREHSYLGLLAIDLADTDTDLASAIEAEQRILTNARRLFEALRDPQAPLADSLGYWLNGMTRPSNMDPRTATLDAIVRTGDLRLMDVSLHPPLLEYSNAVAEMRQLYPGLIFASLEAYFRMGRSYDVFGAGSSNSPPQGAASWDEVRSDMALRSEAGLVLTTALGRLTALRSLQESLEPLKEAIAVRLDS